MTLHTARQDIIRNKF